MQHNSEVAGARFLAGAGRIVTWEKTGITRVWELPLEHRPASEMKSLARLLLGHAETPESKSTGPAESLEGLWQRLRAIYPEYFRVSPQEIRAWHDGEAADWEMRAQWFTAAFHLKCLLALRP